MGLSGISPGYTPSSRPIRWDVIEKERQFTEQYQCKDGEPGLSRADFESTASTQEWQFLEAAYHQIFPFAFQAPSSTLSGPWDKFIGRYELGSLNMSEAINQIVFEGNGKQGYALKDLQSSGVLRVYKLPPPGKFADDSVTYLGEYTLVANNRLSPLAQGKLLFYLRNTFQDHGINFQEGDIKLEISELKGCADPYFPTRYQYVISFPVKPCRSAVPIS